MIRVTRSTVLAVAAACMLIATMAAAHAAGALAVGACGAFGYGFDYKVADARAAAIQKCTGTLQDRR